MPVTFNDSLEYQHRSTPEYRRLDMPIVNPSCSYLVDIDHKANCFWYFDIYVSDHHDGAYIELCYREFQDHSDPLERTYFWPTDEDETVASVSEISGRTSVSHVSFEESTIRLEHLALMPIDDLMVLSSAIGQIHRNNGVPETLFNQLSNRWIYLSNGLYHYDLDDIQEALDYGM